MSDVVHNLEMLAQNIARMVRAEGLPGATIVARECTILSPDQRAELTAKVDALTIYRPHLPITNTGCYLDSARGHYITPEVIRLAQGFGFLVDPFAQYALDRYERAGDGYPIESVQELATEAVEWLNLGYYDQGLPFCAPMAGQNFPPIIPAGFSWEFNDGDFGLYEIDDESEYETFPAREDGKG